MTDVRSDEAPSMRTEAWLFLAIGLLMGLDLLDDLRGARSEMLHMMLEVLVILAALGGLALFWWRAREAAATSAGLAADLVRVQADANRWRAEASAAVGSMRDAIGRQFDRWALTDAERAVAFALLRGESHKAAAAARATSERTVRQQALGIYRKSGLRGRAEFAAFFLGGLRAPGAGEAG